MSKNSKKKYSSAQKSAYHSGMGYSVAYKGKKIAFSSEDLKNSFMAGYRAGSDKIKKSPKKYPDLK